MIKVYAPKEKRNNLSIEITRKEEANYTFEIIFPSKLYPVDDLS